MVSPARHDDPTPDRLRRSDPSLSGERRNQAASLSLPAARAAICFRPRRWLRRWQARRRGRTRHRRTRRTYAGASGPAVHVIPSATIRGRNPVSLARPAPCWAMASLKAWLELPHQPAVVVGFGGYPTVPPLFAARCARIPTRDPRAERGDGPRQPLAGPARARHRDRLSRRPEARAALEPRRRTPAIRCGRGDRGGDDALSPPRAEAAVELLVFGGSQGARVMAEIVPAADRAARAASADAAENHPAGARRGPRRASARPTPSSGRRRGRAVLQGSAGTHGGAI